MLRPTPWLTRPERYLSCSRGAARGMWATANADLSFQPVDFD